MVVNMVEGSFDAEEWDYYILDSVVLDAVAVDVDTYYIDRVDMVDCDCQLVDIDFEVMDIEKNLYKNI